MSTASARLPIEANRGVTGALFGAAVIAFAMRLYIQLFVVKRFNLEDWILVFAVVSLIPATVLIFVSMQNLYNDIDTVLEGSEQVLSVLETLPTESRESNALTTLWWLSIFSVKFAYLAFFRKLISRVRGLSLWWWSALGFMILSFVVCVVISYFACPYTKTEDLIAKCTGPATNRRTTKVAIVTTVFDVLCDIFIASIPIALLWRVKIALRQKVGLGLTLCLSLVMAIVALVRVSGIHLPSGDVDIVWLSFWNEQECNIAVAMLSITAFRSFFVTNASQGNTPPSPGRQLSSLQEKIRRKLSFLSLKKSSRDRSDDDIPLAQKNSGEVPVVQIATKDPNIPSATITGMRTAIADVGRSQAELDFDGA